MNREMPTGMNNDALHPNKDSLAIQREVAAAIGHLFNCEPLCTLLSQFSDQSADIPTAHF